MAGISMLRMSKTILVGVCAFSLVFCAYLCGMPKAHVDPASAPNHSHSGLAVPGMHLGLFSHVARVNPPETKYFALFLLAILAGAALLRPGGPVIRLAERQEFRYPLAFLVPSPVRGPPSFFTYRRPLPRTY